MLFATNLNWIYTVPVVLHNQLPIYCHITSQSQIHAIVIVVPMQLITVLKIWYYIIIIMCFFEWKINKKHNLSVKNTDCISIMHRIVCNSVFRRNNPKNPDTPISIQSPSNLHPATLHPPSNNRPTTVQQPSNNTIKYNHTTKNILKIIIT